MKTKFIPIISLGGEIFVNSQEFIEYAREVLYLTSASNCQNVTKYIGYSLNKERDDALAIEASIIVEKVNLSLSD